MAGGSEKVHGTRPRARLVDCASAEVIKVTRTRTTAVTLAFAAGVGACVSVLLGGFSSGEIDPLSISLVGPFLATWALVVLAANAVAVEYSTGMIQQSLAVTPRRWRFTAAKLLVIAATTLVAGMILALLCFELTQALLSGAGRPSVDLREVEVLRAVIMTGVFSVVYPLIAASLAVVTRSSAAAILLTLLIAFFPMVMAELGSPWWRDVALRFAPGGPMESLTGQAVPGTVGYMDTMPAVLVTLAWLGAFLTAAFVSSARRDA